MANNKQNNSSRSMFSKVLFSYDNCPGIADSLTDKDIENLMKSRKYNMKKEDKQKLKKAEKDFLEKLSYFKYMLRRIQKNVNGTLRNLGLDNGNLKLESTASFEKGEKEMITKLSFQKNEKNSRTMGTVNMNLNLRKLLNYPATELYLLVSASVLNSALSKGDGNKIQDVYNKGLGGALGEYKDAKRQKTEERIYDYALKTFARHIKNIAMYDISEYESKLVAESFIKGMDTNELTSVIMYNFPANGRDINKYIENYQLGDSYDARLEVIRQREKEAMGEAFQKETYDQDTVSFNHTRQYQALADRKLGDKFKASKEALLSGDKSQTREFIESYAQNIVNSINEARKAQGKDPIDPIRIKFINEPNKNVMGEYYESSKEQYIQINLAKVDGIVDLATTLSHEITHYTDSACNKKDGKIGRYNTGLLNDMSEDISDCEYPKGTDEYNLLNEINNVCYLVNPNERNARLSELATYTFMLKYAEGDPRMQEQINGSIKDFIKYQEKTIEQLSKINADLAKFDARFNNLNLSPNSNCRKLIEERLEYLRKIGQEHTLENSINLPEYQAIEQAKKQLTSDQSELGQELGNRFIDEAVNGDNSNSQSKPANSAAKKNDPNKALEEKRKLDQINKQIAEQEAQQEIERAMGRG